MTLALPFCEHRSRIRLPDDPAGSYSAEPGTLAAQLRSRRAALRLTKVVAARRLRICVETYARWEAGLEPSDRNFRRIIRFLGYDPLVGGDSIGGQLRVERLRRGLSTVEVAALLGLDPETIRHVEIGAHNPTRRTRSVIERWLLHPPTPPT